MCVMTLPGRVSIRRFLGVSGPETLFFSVLGEHVAGLRKAAGGELACDTGRGCVSGTR